MFQAGVGRTVLTPFWGVELTGWGYYIERRWQRVHDDLHATALACDDGQQAAVLVTLDLMLIDEAFTRRTRQMIAAETGLPTESILLTCSHSHNAPAAGGLLGVGECDPEYEQWASRQAATAAILAWRSREPAGMSAGSERVPGISFNRTRERGTVDDHLTVVRIDRVDGTPLAVIVNFAAHPTVMTELRPWDVCRDVPGEVCDRLEMMFPGALAMYVQGACGDVSFLREFSSPERCHEPAEALACAANSALGDAREIQSPTVAFASRRVQLPTRRWRREEIDADRSEAQRRQADDDIRDWRSTIGRSMTNRPDDMVARHGGDEHKAVRAMCRFHLAWTERMLADFETRAEVLETEVQALRFGEWYLIANSSEFFSPFALDIRGRFGSNTLMFACYANGRIGYLPDAHDIDARSYAGFQSPKYCNQFPFTAKSGPAMCEASLGVLEACRNLSGIHCSPSAAKMSHR